MKLFKGRREGVLWESLCFHSRLEILIPYIGSKGCSAPSLPDTQHSRFRKSPRLSSRWNAMSCLLESRTWQLRFNPAAASLCGWSRRWAPACSGRQQLCGQQPGRQQLCRQQLCWQQPGGQQPGGQHHSASTTCSHSLRLHLWAQEAIWYSHQDRDWAIEKIFPTFFASMALQLCCKNVVLAEARQWEI